MVLTVPGDVAVLGVESGVDALAQGSGRDAVRIRLPHR